MSRTARTLFALTVAGFVTLVGCKPAVPPVGSAAPPAVSSGPPVTEAEAWAFGEKVVAAMQAKDVPAVAALLRIDDLMERSVSDFGFTANEMTSFRDGVSRSGGSQRMLSFWVDQMGGNSSRRMRVGNRDGRTTVITRMVGAGGLNYMEFTLIRAGDGAVVAEDIYLMAAGEKLSQVLRRLVLPLLAETRKGDRSPAAQAQMDQMTQLSKLGQAFREGRHDEAARLYRGLPAARRDEKVVMLIGLQVLGQTDEPGYLAEIQRYRKLFPNDPSLDLISADYYVLKKDLKGLHDCLGRIEAAVGRDPYLWVLEAGQLAEAGQADEARKLAERAAKEEPTLAEAHWVLVTVALAKDDHAETARVLKVLVETCGADVSADAVATDETYTRFAKTPEFAAFRMWLTERGGGK